MNDINKQHSCIHPTAILDKATKYRDNVTIEPYALVQNSTLGAGCTILHGATIRNVTMGDGCTFGAEIKRSSFDSFVTAKHKNQVMSDIHCGSNVNFGGGFGYANYNGASKCSLHIGNNVFIGAHVLIVGNFRDNKPRCIGSNVFIAANITLRHDVPDNHTVYPTSIAHKHFPTKIVYYNDDYAIIDYDKILIEKLLQKHYI